jgi:SP family myo-inositol transporter-like MFS transporter 13
VLGIADVLFIGGAIGQAVSRNVWDMVGTRFLIGWGVGVASCVAPLYIQELSPTRLRGRMVVVNVVAITLGQVIAYGIAAGFANVPSGWRWMVGLGSVPATVQLVFLFFLPESRESPTCLSRAPAPIDLSLLTGASPLSAHRAQVGPGRPRDGDR